MASFALTFSGTGSVPGSLVVEQGAADVASDKLRINTAGYTDVVVKHTTSLSSATQYAKCTSGVTDFQYPFLVLRYTDSSSGFYIFYIDGNNGGVDWCYKASVSASASSAIQSGTLSGSPFYSGESVGITIEGTGTSTTVRLWSNVTADAPTDASTWDGAGPQLTFTNDPPTPVNGGSYVGIGATQGTANQVQFTKFSGGDLGGGSPQALAGDATAAATATGNLSHGVPLAGGAAGQAAGTGGLTHGVPLQGDATATTDAAADVSVSGASVIAFRSLSSAPQSGISSVLFRQPDVLEAGDVAFWCVVNKYPTNGPNTPTGYTLTSQAVMGDGGSAGADQGDVYATVFHRVCDGTEDAATEAISIPSGNAAYSRSIAFSRSGGTGWSIAAAAGSQGTASGTWSIVTGNLDLAAGDTVLVFIAKNSDLDVVSHSGHSFSATGVTFGTFNSRAGPTGTTSGDDVAYQLGEVQVTAGAGTGPVTFGMSASGSAGNSSGGVMLVRLRATTAVDLAGTATGAAAAAAALALVKPLAGTAAGAAAAAAAMTLLKPLGGSAAATAVATAVATLLKPLAGTAVGDVQATAALSGATSLAGTAAGQAAASAALDLLKPLAGSAAGDAVAAAVMALLKPLLGAAAASAAAAGDLAATSSIPVVLQLGRHNRPGRGPYSLGRYFRPSIDAFTPPGYADLSGVASGLAGAAGAISLGVPLAGNAAAVASASAGLQLLKALAGAAAGQSSAVGSLDGSVVTLSGAAVAQATAVGGLTHAVPLEGAAVAVAGAAGQLAVSVVLTGAALAQASAAAAFLGSVNLSGAAAAQAGVSGTLSLSVPLGAQAQAIAAASGGLVLTVVLQGDAVASAGASGGLVADVMMSGAAVGQGSASGTLRVIGYAVFTRPPRPIKLNRRRQHLGILRDQ